MQDWPGGRCTVKRIKPSRVHSMHHKLVRKEFNLGLTPIFAPNLIFSRPYMRMVTIDSLLSEQKNTH